MKRKDLAVGLEVAYAPYKPSSAPWTDTDRVRQAVVLSTERQSRRPKMYVQEYVPDGVLVQYADYDGEQVEQIVPLRNLVATWAEVVHVREQVAQYKREVAQEKAQEAAKRRAKAQATKALIEAHRAEYDALLAQYQEA